ncbi:MAG: rod shape-determining protein MreC [Patescibacteria group bacterium]|nr:rod shape-determining protein MreC [Patescibacteria group bacterium]
MINKKIIGIILIITSFFLFNLTSVSRGIEGFFYSVSSPIQRWLWDKGLRVSDFITSISTIQDLKEENKSLELKTKELINKDILLDELKRENEFLRTALGLGLEKDFDLEIAQVIAREISSDFLMINKGSADGLEFGDIVITEQKALLGKLAQVYESVSKVKLITAKNNSFDVKIFEKEIYGLAKGLGNFNLYLDFIPREKEIDVSERVITSSLGGNFPSGLFVGEIKNVKKSDITAFQEAEIAPGFKIQELDYLFIITNF